MDLLDFMRKLHNVGLQCICYSNNQLILQQDVFGKNGSSSREFFDEKIFKNRVECINDFKKYPNCMPIWVSSKYDGEVFQGIYEIDDLVRLYEYIDYFLKNSSIEKINNFTDILPIENNLETVLALDIDETVLYFTEIHKGWWKDNFDQFYEVSKDYDHADRESLNKWFKTIENKIPIVTDQEGINELIKISNDTKLIFITARHESSEIVTKQHLLEIGFDSPTILFCDIKSKGIVLKQWLIDNDLLHKQIIFIDDKDYNIKDVKNELPGAICYQFDGFW